MTCDELKMARVINLFDLTMLLVVAVVNLNLIPVVAGAGPSILSLWLLAFLLFFLPQTVAVLELSARYHQEGGIYVWSKAAFGDFHGFLSGWCYWTNNIFYIPTLLLYLVNFSLFIGGKSARELADSTLFMTVASLCLLWLLIGVNIRGMSVGKWVQNVGAIATFCTVLVFVGIAVVAVRWNGMANSFEIATLMPGLSQWHTFSALGLLCFAFVGMELGSVVGNEIKRPRVNIPRAVVIAGCCCVMLYVLCSFALQATIPLEEINVVSGLLQAAERAASVVNLTGAVRPLALLITLSVLGAFCAWLAGSARIPFVIGIDRYLPPSLGKVHSRYRTPHVALVVQGGAISLVMLLASAGSTVRDVYLLMLNTAVIIQLIPFLYMFAALIKIRKTLSGFNPDEGFFKKSWLCYLSGSVGFSITALGILLAFIPPDKVDSILLYEAKIVLACISFVIPAVFLFRRNAGRRETDMSLKPSADKRPPETHEGITIGEQIRL